MKIQKWIGITMAAVLTVGLMSGCGEPTPTSSVVGTGQPSAKTSEFNLNKPITVVSREDGSGTRGAFIELFEIQQKDANGNKTDKTTTEAIVANKTDVMLTNISGDPYAIGYVSLGSLSSKVKALKIDGTAATAENVKNGTYKIARPFNIATKGEASPVAQDFIDFILSKEGQETVSDGYIPVKEDAPAYSGTKPAGKIVVSGSSSVSPIMEKLKEAYLAVNTNAAIEIQTSDSTAGMTGAMDGSCDIGMASRDLTEKEKAALKDIQIALDGIAVIVHPQNSFNEMTSEQVKEIFTGEALEWSEISK